MALVINTNIMALNAQNNLNKSQNELAVALQRLSSGLRINSAKDDAAGLAIATRFTSQINGLNQATRNANDAISLSQTADGGLATTTNLLQRIRELAVQSANATNSGSDRQSLNNETQQLLAEVQRIAQTTQFNGQNLLDGSFTAQQFQVGANANQTITVSLGSAGTSALGAYQYTNTTTPVTNQNLSAGDIVINGVSVGATSSNSAEAKATAINQVSSLTGVTASASTTRSSSTNVAVKRNQTLQAGDLVINGVDIGVVSGSNNVGTQGAAIAAAINAVTNTTGVTATADATTGAITLSSSTGANISITTNNGAAGATRVENATGITSLVSGTAPTAASDVYTFNGTAGVHTLTLGTNNTSLQVSSGDTVTVDGKTYQFTNGGAASGTNIAVDLTGVTTNDGAVTALKNAIAANDSNVTLGTTPATSSTGGVLTITSNVLSSTDYSATTVGTVNSGDSITSASTATAAGIAVGDTLSVGGVTYTFINGTPTASNQVSLNQSSTANLATAFAAAVTNEYGADSTNIQATHSASTVTLTSDLLGSSGVATVTGSGSAIGTGQVTAAAVSGGADAGSSTSQTVFGTISLSSASAFSISGAAPDKAGLQGASSTLNAINAVNISTVSGANSAISLIDGAISQVTKLRAELGAIQNRVQATISNLTTAAQNITAARSQIMDANFAAETSALTRDKILQQAGTAVLAQANAIPNNVLTLLR